MKTGGLIVAIHIKPFQAKIDDNNDDIYNNEIVKRMLKGLQAGLQHRPARSADR